MAFADFYEAFVEVGLHGHVSRILVIVIRAGGERLLILERGGCLIKYFGN